jgi:tripartite-type tricarboxylate transporter receptor subunit TctC
LGVISWWLASLASLAQAQTQTFPDRPVRMVVPFAAGGPVDVIGRIMSQELSKALKQQFVVDNRLGAGGTIAAEHVATAPADGHTLLFGSTSTLAVAPALYSRVAYHPVKSFVPVSAVSLETLALLVNPAVPASNVRELVAYLKANPGKVNYASPGNGTPFHLSGELFKAQTGTSMVHVPYKGAAPAVADLLAGQVQLLFDNIPNVLPHIRAGKLRAIVSTGSTRLSTLPEVPTLAELGVRGYDFAGQIGLVAPAGTSREVIARLHGEIVKALRQPELIERMTALGIDPVGNTPEDYARLIRADLEKFARAVKISGAVAE